MDTTFFSKLVKDAGGENVETKTLLYIKSKWSETAALELLIYSSDTNESFKGELSADQMCRNAADLEKPLEEFYDECKEAITANIVTTQYLYRLDNETFKLIKKHPFEITLLEIPLKKLSSPLQILDNTFEEISNLMEKKEAKESLEQHEEMSTQETLETLRNCLKEKEQVEKMLLRKFLMLLNSKKEEIGKLKDQLEAGGGGVGGNNHNQQQQHETSNEEPDEFEADTQPFSADNMEN